MSIETVVESVAISVPFIVCAVVLFWAELQNRGRRQ